MQLPNPPTRLDSREDFILKMDAFVQALPKCINELQSYIETMQSTTDTKLEVIQQSLASIQSMTAAVTKAEKSTRETQLLAAQGVCPEWEAGKAYLKGNTVYSAINNRVYKAKVNTQDNVDPSTSNKWQPAILHTGLFIDKAYAPRELQTQTHWLVLKEGTYTLPSCSENEIIPEQYAIMITCKTEQEQTEMLEKFLQEGVQCRALMS